MTNNQNNLGDSLWNHSINPEHYDTVDKYQDHILEQYKIYVEMADRISSRRNLANTFFLTLNSIVLGTIGFAFDKILCIKNEYILFIPLIAILALCYVWWRLIKSYRQLNTAKYSVIGEMEKKLPASPYYFAEWNALGEGKNRKLYVPLTHVENWIPVIFAGGYIFICVYSLFL